MSFFVPTRFVWRFGGQQVHLCGSFTRWVETVPMAAVDGQPGMFSVVVHLPPGYHQYKFIVDGDWRHDEQQPYMPDPLGNVNNWIFVRRSDSIQQGIQHSSQQTAPVLPNQGGAIGGGGVSGIQLKGSANSNSDVEMPPQDGVMVPVAMQEDDPGFTLRKIQEFLQSHTAYELIPESNKVVLIDMDFPVRQAFHALHEQGVASVPLWDGRKGRIAGMISPSDFINALMRLRTTMTQSPLSEAEMDSHTIRMMREEAEKDGKPSRDLVYVKPEDSLQHVIQMMFDHKCHMAPVLSCDPKKDQVSEVLHVATVSHVLACLMRHFMTSWTSLPWLAQPVGNVPMGTWNPTSPMATDKQFEGTDNRDCRKIRTIGTVQLDSPITEAFSHLLEKGVSSLPVLDESGSVVDVYSRADITLLAKGNSYSRMQWEDVTVGQAIALANASNATNATTNTNTNNNNNSNLSPSGIPQHTLQIQNVSEHTQIDSQYEGRVIGGLSASLRAVGSAGDTAQNQQAGTVLQHSLQPHQSGPTRVWCATRQDSLRTVIERLSMPSVRRIMVVEAETRKLEGVISLSDVAQYFFLS
eukprot:TRINITY_DN12068_c0_g1_i1.p1 TRINITY_DN12068_c0_g1~~TRINITY_DN12068_c0_g1_i1.p1  ORF type:complete len:580 (+),score=58.64 TRINITY_DN12068_c0_g1_i1:205-1944(+)